MIRCLLVDDSPTFRAVLRLALEARPGVEVVGEAADGDEGLRLAIGLRPDVVLMDVRMPGRDGVDATRAIMARAPTRVLVLSMDEDLALGLRALQAGAVDVFAKPRSTQPGGIPAQVARICEAVVSVAARPVRSPRAGGAAPGLGGAPALPPLAVGIATSTGGPKALLDLLGALPAPYPLPVLVVQHLADGFHEGLARWLAHGSHHDVRLAEDDAPLRPGTIWLGRHDRHLGVEGDRVRLLDGPPVNGFRPSGCALFRSLAAAHGGRAAGIVLTGMGRDGADGLLALRAAGGYTAAQGPATSVVFGMPDAAIRAGAAAHVLELEELAAALRGLAGLGS